MWKDERLKMAKSLFIFNADFRDYSFLYTLQIFIWKETEYL